MTRYWILSLLVGILLSSAPNSSAASHRETPLVVAIRKTRPAVVNIHSQKQSPSQGDSSASRMSGMGTGVIVDERGYIITNYHVIEDVSKIRITLVDGSTFDAEVIGRDKQTDLALLRINPIQPLTVMPLGRSDDLLYGESVIAIGNAFGYEHTITQGIISELHRDVKLSEKQGYNDLIQTDAAINPGNSGGPLINIDGEMIGLNVAIRAGAQNIGFAIPIAEVKRVLRDLMSTRRLNGTWHGIIPSESATGTTVTVRDVEAGSPADQAGIQPGDHIVSVAGRQIQYAFDVERALLDKHAREEVAVRVKTTEGERDVALALAPAEGKAAESSNESVWSEIGIRLAPHNNLSELRQYSADLRGGLLVSSVRPNSPAERAGVQVGDVLVGMNVGIEDFEMLSESHVRYVLQLRRQQKINSLVAFVVRTGKMYRAVLDLAR